MKNIQSERWQQIERLFAEAIELPAHERGRFVGACASEPGVRDEVERLLEAHDRAGGFLDEMDADRAAALLEPTIEGLDEGASIGPYRVIRRLGRGGMGIVYLTEDARLDRRVAVKLLPTTVHANERARRRFTDEAKAASAPDHPHIVTIYEIGELADDRMYIAMAYYEGGTLRDRIDEGPLSVEEAVDLAGQIADGLSAAHRRGIIHRDIKPENILVTSDGIAKIADFGVAKIRGSTLTREGMQPGTIAYMSPEQTRAERVDHRSDLWSLGVLLYEMLTGQRPFRGETEEVVVYGIRNDDPPRIESLRPGIPAMLARVVNRCLIKNPDERFGNAESLLAELKSADSMITDPGEAVEREGIVVLPFTNMSPDPDDEYLSDGLTEEVISNLSHLRALRVISRTSSMRLKGTEKEVRAIARELGVRYVLEGSIRKSGSAIRISTQLIDAPYDVHRWAGKIDGTVSDIFEMQEQVAHAVAEALRIRLSAGENRALSSRPIRDTRAYESFLRARYEAYRFSREGLERAQRHIESALTIVGDNELLYSTLGHIKVMYIDVGIESHPEALERVEALTEKVFALNPDSVRGHLLKAYVAFFRGDLRNAMDAGKRGLALDPEDADLLLLLGYVYGHAGRNADALACFDRALELDPLTPLVQAVPGFIAVLEGRFADALEPYRRYHELEPDSPFGMVFYGWALGYDRRFDEAIVVLRDVADKFPGTVFASYARSLAHALQGESEEAIRAITPAFEAAAKGSEMFARELAHCYALGNQKEKALDWLEHEVRLGMKNYSYLAEHDWFLDGLRGERRFEELLARVKAESADLMSAG